jgi:hypothetical protein
MNRFIVPALALAVLAAPSLVEAQQRGGGRGLGALLQENPIQTVLERADSLQLGLTADQAASLQALSAELDEANAPHQEALQGLMGGGAPDMAAIMPHLQAIQEGNQGAIQGAREGILTAEQWGKVDPFLQALQAAGRGRGGRRGGGAPG